MRFTVLKPELDYYGGKNPATSKLFVDGEQVKRKLRPYWYSECADYQNEGENLHPLFLAIKDIHEENKNRLVLQEPIKRKDGDLLRANSTLGYLDGNSYWDWFLAEFDEGEEGCNANAKPLDELLPELCERLGFVTFGETEMIVRRSNKHGFAAYPDHYAVHIYLRLETPQTPTQLRNMLLGWADIFDLAPFSKCRQYWVQPPEVHGSVSRKVIDDGVVYYSGKPVSLDAIRSCSRYKENAQTFTRFTTSLNNLKDFRVEGEELEQWKQLAQEGFFNNNRFEPLYKILGAAEWTNQNGEQIKNALLVDKDEALQNGTTPIIGYNRGEKELDEQLRAIRDNNKAHFTYFLENKDFTYKLKDPKQADLKNADLSELVDLLVSHFKEKKPIAGILRSAHGSAKTTAVVPLLKKAMQEVINEPLRVIYICTLRSIIRSTCEALEFACYITTNGVIDDVLICSADELGICLKSLHHITRTPHLLICDESEELGMWAAWDNSNHNILVDLIAHTPVSLLQDADAAEMTYSLLQRATSKPEIDTYLLENSESWIAQQNQMMVMVQKEIQIYEEIVTRVENDEYVFVHVDFSDKKQEITALVNAFNDYFGRDIAKGFADQSSTKELLALTTDTNNYLSKLHSDGIRIIIASPVWQHGLRYHATPRWNATFGIYRQNILTARAITQRTQRGVAVPIHYVYVNPASTYVDLRQLQRELDDYYGLSEQYSTVGWNRELDKVELHNEAQTLKAKLLANVKLHLCIYWRSFSGSLQFLTPLGTHEEDKEFRYFRELIAESKAEARLAQAEMILASEDGAKALAGRFTKGDVDIDGYKQLPPPTTPQEVIELLDLVELESLHHETAKDMYHILMHEEMNWIEWDMAGAPWEPIDITRLTSKKTEFGYRVLGALLQRIVDVLPFEWNDKSNHLLEFLCTPKARIVIDSDTDLSNIRRLMHTRNDLLRTKLEKVMVKGATPEKLLTAIFKKIFLCEVKETKPISGEVSAAKRALVEHYRERKLIPKTGNKQLRISLPQCRKILKDKILNEEELSDIESHYLNATGSIIEIVNRDYIDRRRLQWVMITKPGLLGMQEANERIV